MTKAEIIQNIRRKIAIIKHLQEQVLEKETELRNLKNMLAQKHPELLSELSLSSDTVSKQISLPMKGEWLLPAIIGGIGILALTSD